MTTDRAQRAERTSAVQGDQGDGGEAPFRSLVQHTPGLVAVMGADGVISYVGPSVTRLLGYTPDELLGRRFAERVVYEDQPRLERMRAQLLERPGEPVSIQVRVRHRDGSVHVFEGSVINLLDDPEVKGAVVHAHDVTDRYAAESARARSEEALRAIVQSSPLAILALDRRGVVHVWSRACEDMFGFSSADVIGKQPLMLDDESSVEFMALVDRVFAGETIRGHDARYLRHDGTAVDAEVAIAPLRDRSGRVVTAVAVLADVSEQKRAIQSLAEREVRFRSLVQHSSDMITVLDGNGDTSYMSPSAWRFLGIDPSDDPRVPVTRPSPAPEDAQRLTTMFDALRSQPGATQSMTFRLQRADGEYRWIDLVSTNLLDDPAVAGIVNNARDITERFEAQAAVAASEERLRAMVESLRESEGRVRESEARYRAVVDDQTELVCRYLPDTTLTFVNRAFADFYGRTPQELMGTPLIEVFPPDERDREMERLRSFGPGSDVQTYDDWEIAANGSKHWYRWVDRAFLDDDGTVAEFQSVGHDISEERRATALTEHQAEILEQVARGVPLRETLQTIAATVEDHFPWLSCAMFLVGPEGTSMRLAVAPSLSPRFVDSLDGTAIGPADGSCGTAAFRRSPVIVADITTDPLWAHRRDLALEHGLRSSWSTPVLASDGDTVLGTLDVFGREPRTPDDEHQRIVGLLAHLASIAIERKAFEDRLAHQSMHDPLTGLPNRLLFLDRLGLAVARCRRTRSQVAVLFLDLDRFKNVNDGLGHDAGDELLVAVARRLEAMLRPGDTVARFGGDEFTILCEDLPAESAAERSMEIAHRLLGVVSQPFVVRGTDTFVGASIGIAHASNGDERPEELLRNADAAMYHAKEGGRGRVDVFDETMRARALARHATENALHRALERGELRVFFQPVVALADARCVGAEALVRWQHPERGLIAPAEFVPLAEETGLVGELGAWVLAEAASHAAKWQIGRDRGFLVSVNLSARQLAQPDLAERAAEVIDRTGVDPSNLCFEITESVLMDDADSVISVIERVRDLGVRLAIDDFGTGYSSLGYLKRFPIDIVKIDRSFVAGLGTDAGDVAIVSAVIGLAHALGLRVVAEGVETEEQLSELVMLGCDEAQGYFFAPPQPVQDLQDLLRKTRRWRPPGTRVIQR